jgi:hypothetical protein
MVRRGSRVRVPERASRDPQWDRKQPFRNRGPLACLRSRSTRRKRAFRSRLAARVFLGRGLSGLVLVGLPRAPAVEAQSPLDGCVACAASSALNDRAVRRGGQVRVIGRGVGREFDLAVIAIVGHACRRIQSRYASQASLESVERRIVDTGNPQSKAAPNRPASAAWVLGPSALPAFSLTGRCPGASWGPGRSRSDPRGAGHAGYELGADS